MLEYAELIIEKHIVVHNAYLQLWAEDGIVGLLLFLAVVVSSLAAGWRAVRLFEAVETTGWPLARTTFLALIAILIASFFLSDLEVGQLWVLLALGPVMKKLAIREAYEVPQPAPLPAVGPRLLPAGASLDELGTSSSNRRPACRRGLAGPLVAPMGRHGDETRHRRSSLRCRIGRTPGWWRSHQRSALRQRRPGRPPPGIARVTNPRPPAVADRPVALATAEWHEPREPRPATLTASREKLQHLSLVVRRGTRTRRCPAGCPAPVGRRRALRALRRARLLQLCLLARAFRLALRSNPAAPAPAGKASAAAPAGRRLASVRRAARRSTTSAEGDAVAPQLRGDRHERAVVRAARATSSLGIAGTSDDWMPPGLLR